MPQPHVLVVDPNPTTLRRVKAALEDTGYGILSARDAIEAEQQANGHEIALVLSSTGLPRGNGYDLARILLSRAPSTKVFLISGGFEVYNRERAEQAGVAGRISKPFSAEGLREKLEKVLGTLEPPAPEPLIDDDPIDMGAGLLQPTPASSFPPAGFHEPLKPTYRPLVAQERIASILPRSYEQVPADTSPAALSPALERSIMEVLPEVVEAVLKLTLQSSPAFRDLVEVAVDEAVRSQLPDIARRVIEERLVELEAAQELP